MSAAIRVEPKAYLIFALAVILFIGAVVGVVILTSSGRTPEAQRPQALAPRSSDPTPEDVAGIVSPAIPAGIRIGQVNDNDDPVLIEKHFEPAPGPTIRIPRDGRQYYVSPDGRPGNRGTRESPWDIISVFEGGQDRVRPGDIIWLRGGTYGPGGDFMFVCSINGTQDRPIIFRQYPGERATINGGLQLTGRDIWFWGFEVTNTSENRRGGATAGTGDLGTRPHFNVTGPRARLINLVINNVGHPAPGFWRPVGDQGEMHGCLLWGNGLYPQGNFPSGSLYAQNSEGTRYITDLIAFRNFTIGIKPSSDGVAQIDGFHIEGNAAFDNPQWNILLFTRNEPMQRNKIIGNFLFTYPDDNHKGSLQLGYYNVQNRDIEVRDNYIVSGRGDGSDRAFLLRQFADVKVTGNTIVGPRWLANFIPPAQARHHEWNNNAYYGGSDTPFRNGGEAITFEEWKNTTGYDADSRLSRDYPTHTRIFVRPNRYEAGRGNVIVYNWSKKESVEVDLAPILRNGERFVVRDAQNFFGEPVIRGVYEGQPIEFPMNLDEVAQPIGKVPHIQGRFRHTAPEFAVFVVFGERTVFTP